MDLQISFFFHNATSKQAGEGEEQRGGNKIKELERDSGAEAKGAPLICLSFFLDIQVCIEGRTSDEWIAMGGDGEANNTNTILEGYITAVL